MGQKYAKYEHVKNVETPLKIAQTLKKTKNGLPINQSVTNKLMSKKALERMKKVENLAPDVRIIMNPPFSEVDRVTDNLYLTGVAGLTEENIYTLRITCIINATYEMPLLKIKGIESYRVPIDDDGEEEIILYFDDVANLIDDISKNNGKTIVHCMAGASRSSTLVLAYLIKYHDMSLRNAFCYLKSLRACARPNLGFFQQLIAYEKYYRKETSVEIIEIVKKGKKIQVPDFYPQKFPDLFKAEVARQISKTISGSKLQESQMKNVINARRKYIELNREIQEMAVKNENSQKK